MNSRISDETRVRIDRAWPSILVAIAGGELVGATLASHGITTDMMRAYKDGSPILRAQWEEAKEQSAEAFIDEAVLVARNVKQPVRDELTGEYVVGKDGQPLLVANDPAYARVRIDTLKWAARIRNPKAYSDKAQLDVNVRTIDLTRIISEANARLADRRPVRVLEHDAGAAIAEHGAKLLQLL